jgi:general secretion pathway protein C
MSSRWTGFFIWALVAASAAFWSLKIFAATRPVPPGAQAPQAIAANGPMERLFGAVVVPTAANNAPPPESSRFQLVGVIAPPSGSAGDGYAVVSIDSQPAHAWHVGSTLDGSTSLLAVSKRGAEFGPSGGPTSFSLQLPEPAAAETGALPAATSQPDPAQLQQQMQQQIQQLQRNNAQPGAQPQFPAQGGMPGRGSIPRPIGRAGIPGTQNGVAPARVAQPPDQTEAPPLQQ